jgi:hypothetical protein
MEGSMVALTDEDGRAVLVWNGWTFDRSRDCYEQGNRRVYPLERGGFVISEDEAWLPDVTPFFHPALARVLG